MEHLFHSARRELQKMGRLMSKTAPARSGNAKKR